MKRLILHLLNNTELHEELHFVLRLYVFCLSIYKIKIYYVFILILTQSICEIII